MPLSREDITKLRKQLIGVGYRASWDDSVLFTEGGKAIIGLLESSNALLRLADAALTMREGLGNLEEIRGDWVGEWIEKYTAAFDKAVSE